MLGKTDMAGAVLLPAVMEFGPEIVAAGLVRALAAAGIDVAAHVAVPAPVRAAFIRIQPERDDD